jgi:dihydrofolate reductase
MKFAIIAAVDKKMGIGKDNRLPWKLKGDMQYFSVTTTEAPDDLTNAVIMGRNTWLSLPEKFRPLANRINVVLSREKMELPKGVIWASSFEDAFEKLNGKNKLGEVFVIGGANIYAQAIARPECKRIYLTEIEDEFDCDTYFPSLPASFFKESESDLNTEKGISYKFTVYSAK